VRKVEEFSIWGKDLRRKESRHSEPRRKEKEGNSKGHGARPEGEGSLF